MKANQMRANIKKANEIKDGMEVIVTLDDSTEFRTKTRSDPWELGHGAWVVLLDGIAGGYLLNRVKIVEAIKP